MAWPNKDPSDVLDYAIDWTNELDEETIVGSSWAVSHASLVIDSDTIAGARAVVWLSDGLAGFLYAVTNTITTSAGRTFERSVSLRVEER